MQNIERIVTKAKALNNEFFIAEYKTVRNSATFVDFSHPSKVSPIISSSMFKHILKTKKVI